MQVDATIIAAFWAKVEKSDACWLWRGARTKADYGQIKINGKVFYAHRVSWFIHFGNIPDTLSVCHRCDNPPCIRPDHLFTGTARDNARDMIMKGRHKAQKD